MVFSMLVTDSFVMILFPKTGSTFAADSIKGIYAHRKKKKSFISLLCGQWFTAKRSFAKTIMLPQSEFATGNNALSHQHGRCEEIPEEYRDKPIVSIVRNPHARNISTYEFRWWADHPIPPVDILKREFPKFPDLSFKEFLTYQNFNIQYRVGIDKLRVDLGNQTIQFIQFFFKNPSKIFPIFDDDYVLSGLYRNDIYNIQFLATERLNLDLYKFLNKTGYRKSEIDFILNKKKLRPRNTFMQSASYRKKYLTPEIVEMVARKERLLYQIYADHGIVYDPEKYN